MDGIGYFLFFLIVFLALTVLLLWPVFPYLVVAVLLVELLRPLDLQLAKRVPSAAQRAATLTLLVLIAFAIPLVYAVQRLAAELGAAVQPDSFHHLIDSTNSWLVRHQAQFVADWVLKVVPEIRDFLFGLIPSLFGSAFDISLGIIVCLFVFYYLVKEGHAIWQGFLNAVPLPTQLKAELDREVSGIVRAIVYGQVLTSFVQGVIGGLGLVIFGVAQPLLLTILMVLASFIPLLGTPLVWIPAALFKLVTGHTIQGVGLLIYGTALVINVDNFLRPRLIAMHSEVHPVVILIGIIGGTKVFGFIGFLVGPVIFAVFLQLLQFFSEFISPGDAAVPPSAT